jgi:hypothetical protein
VLLVEPAEHLGIVAFGRQLGELDQVRGALGQGAPAGDLFPQPFGGSQNVLRGALVGPEVGATGLLVELGQPFFLGG